MSWHAGDSCVRTRCSNAQEKSGGAPRWLSLSKTYRRTDRKYGSYSHVSSRHFQNFSNGSFGWGDARGRSARGNGSRLCLEVACSASQQKTKHSVVLGWPLLRHVTASKNHLRHDGQMLSRRCNPLRHSAESNLYTTNGTRGKVSGGQQVACNRNSSPPLSTTQAALKADLTTRSWKSGHMRHSRSWKLVTDKYVSPDRISCGGNTNEFSRGLMFVP